MRIRPTPAIACNVDFTTALLDAARAAARAAATVDFNPDPLLPPEVSRLGSAVASAVKRHGPLLERAIGDALEAGGLIVLRNVSIPITRAALALVDSKDNIHPDKQINFDGDDIVDRSDGDLVVIDESQGWAALVQAKRGGGPTESRKRRADERGLRACRLTLASYLRQNGYRGVDFAEIAVVDFYGQSGYAKDLVIVKSELDDYFGLPVNQTIDEMTAIMRDALGAELLSLLRPIITKFSNVEPPVAIVRTDAQPTIRLRGRRALDLGVAATREAASLHNTRRN